jgi:hypothetical protein
MTSLTPCPQSRKEPRSKECTEQEGEFESRWSSKKTRFIVDIPPLTAPDADEPSEAFRKVYFEMELGFSSRF